MTRIAEPFLAELDQEAETTRRVLERVPNDKLGWKPHPKSMSLGQLALHVATIPGFAVETLVNDSFELPVFDQPSAKSAAELIPTLEGSVRNAKKIVGSLDNQKVMGTWKLTRMGKRGCFRASSARFRGSGG